MPLKKLSLAIPLLCGANLFGVVQETVDGKRPITVSFSTSTHNRIAVEDGAVEKVFGDSSIFSVTVDPVTGNAFVNLVEEIGETPATLSVVTSTGLVQDLLVSSRQGVSEQVLLREKEEGSFYQHGVSMGATVEVLSKVLEGKVPFGFGQKDTAEPLNLPAPLTALALKAFEGPFETITLYRVTNEGSESVVLSAEALKKENSWAFFNAQELEGGKPALCLIGRLKEGI